MATRDHIPNGQVDRNSIATQRPTSIEVPDVLFSDHPVHPKTPADEGIAFFESPIVLGEEPIRVYELLLDPDGGPNKALSVGFMMSFLYLLLFL